MKLNIFSSTIIARNLLLSLSLTIGLFFNTFINTFTIISLLSIVVLIFCAILVVDEIKSEESLIKVINIIMLTLFTIIICISIFQFFLSLFSSTIIISSSEHIEITTKLSFPLILFYIKYFLSIVLFILSTLAIVLNIKDGSKGEVIPYNIFILYSIFSLLIFPLFSLITYNFTLLFIIDLLLLISYISYTTYNFINKK